MIYFLGIATVIQTFCFYNNVFERLADYYFVFSILFIPLILSRKEYSSKPFESIQNSQISSISSPNVTLEKKKIQNLSIEDIDINTVLALIITVFCIWRFFSYVNSNSSSLMPFYFFWQG